MGDVNYCVLKRVYKAQAEYWWVFLDSSRKGWAEYAIAKLSDFLEAAEAEVYEASMSGALPESISGRKAEILWLRIAIEKIQGL